MARILVPPDKLIEVANQFLPRHEIEHLSGKKTERKKESIKSRGMFWNTLN